MGKVKQLEIVIDGISMSISEATVDKVLSDYERANPGRIAESMSSEEFASRMMAELKDSAFQTTKGNA